ncbi:unnamed protein product [Discosporangium mesarthrocarpum]
MLTTWNVLPCLAIGHRVRVITTTVQERTHIPATAAHIVTWFVQCRHSISAAPRWEQDTFRSSTAHTRKKKMVQSTHPPLCTYIVCLLAPHLTPLHTSPCAGAYAHSSPLP